jgi:hypothetical protein
MNNNVLNITFILIYGMMLLSIATPFIALIAVSRVKKKNYALHIRIQKTLLWICVTGIVILELKIRFAGGSGSLVSNNEYIGTHFLDTY